MRGYVVTSELTPRSNTKLYGHEEIEEILLHDLRDGRLAHGIILSGPRGIGKATLAYRFARTLLSGRNDMELPDNDQVFHRIVADSHSDLLVIELLYDPKKDEYANEISIEQSRTIAQALSLTPGEGQWRVVIIDSADALNVKSANAILKILEEPPPQTVIMLIAHNVGQLLPTIRSRCRIVSLKPLSRSNFEMVLYHTAPEITGEELAALGVISGFSPGIAMGLKEQGALELYNEILDLFASARKIDSQHLLRFCEQIGSGKKAHANWQLFSHIVLCILERITKKSSKAAVTLINREEAGRLEKLATMHSPDIWARKWQEALGKFLLAQRLHLDYKQVALTFFHSLASAEEFTLGNIAA